MNTSSHGSTSQLSQNSPLRRQHLQLVSNFSSKFFHAWFVFIISYVPNISFHLHSFLHLFFPTLPTYSHRTTIFSHGNAFGRPQGPFGDLPSGLYIPITSVRSMRQLTAMVEHFCIICAQQTFHTFKNPCKPL